MAYNNQCIVSVIIDDNPLRESYPVGSAHPNVYMHFDTEYKLRIKNKNSFPVGATIHVDDTDIMAGHTLIIGANETVNLERFLTDNYSQGRKLKFVPLGNQQVADPTNPHNGLIVVKFFKAEKTIQYTEPIIIRDNLRRKRGLTRGGSQVYGCNTMNFMSSSSCPASFSTTGATVEGSESNQEFSCVNDYYMGQEIASITLQIMGIKRGKKSPLKNYCSKCGSKIAIKDNYCASCGRRL